MAELKPCPFCGDNQQLNYVELSNGLHYIECARCGAAPHRLGARNRETAVRYWNSVNRWIPCSERLPETPYEGFGVHFYYSDCVLVSGKDWLGMAYYVTEDGESRWEFADARTKQVIDWVEITHWMPITPPPESEVHNE